MDATLPCPVVTTALQAPSAVTHLLLVWPKSDVNGGVHLLLAWPKPDIKGEVHSLTPQYAMVQAVQVLTQVDAMGPQLLLQRPIVHSLVSLVSSQHIAAVRRWPPWAAGALGGVQSIVSLVASVLHMPFLLPGATEAFLKEVQEVSHTKHYVAHVTLDLMKCLDRPSQTSGQVNHCSRASGTFTVDPAVCLAAGIGTTLIACHSCCCAI